MNKPRLWLSTLAFGLLAGGGAMADPLTLDDISAWLNASRRPVSRDKEDS